MRSARICTGLIACLLVAACGSAGTIPAEINELPFANAPAADTGTPASVAFPTALPTDGLQPWEVDTYGIRGSSATSSEEQYSFGKDWFLASPDVDEAGEAARLAPEFGESSWALYRIPLSGQQPGSLGIDVNYPLGSQQSGSGYSVAIANYATGRWDWYGPFDQPHLVLAPASNVQAGADYLSSSGNCFIAINVSSSNPLDLVGIGVVPLDNSDKAEPAAPTGGDAKPVAGGSEISWLAPADEDVAGYLVSHSALPFHRTDSPGVKQIPGLARYPGLIMPAYPDGRYLRIQSVDHNGNVSEPGEMLFAASLPESVMEFGLIVQSNDVPAGFSTALLASGAEEYQFALDGDPRLAETASSGTYLPDTTSPGVCRITVRAKAGDSVWLSGATLIVTEGQRPQADASCDPNYGVPPLDVLFDGSASTDADGTIVGSGWDLDGDGIFDVWDAQSLQYLQYPLLLETATGPLGLKPQLRVIDNDGLWDRDYTQVIVQGQLPEVVLAVNPPYGFAGGTYTLDASASTSPDDAIASYGWDFDGDGTIDSTGTEAVVEHVFEQAGAPQAKVIAFDSRGWQSSAQATVLVNPQPASSPRPTSGYDGRHTGQTGNLFPLGNIQRVLEQDFNSGAAGFAQVMDGNGRIISSVASTIRVLNSDLSDAWSKTFPSNIGQSPYAGPDGTVYVSCEDFNLYALDEDGNQKWAYKAGGPLVAGPVPAIDGNLLQACVDGRVYCISLDGNLVWMSNQIARLELSPSQSLSGEIYVVDVDGRLHALDASGNRLWDYEADEKIARECGIDLQGNIYFTLMNTGLVSLDPAGQLRWTYELEGIHSYRSPVIWLDGSLLVADNDSAYRVSPAGEFIWSTSFSQGAKPYGLTPDQSGNVLVTSNHWLMLLDSGGSLLWEHQINDQVENGDSFVDSQGRIIYGRNILEPVSP